MVSSKQFKILVTGASLLVVLMLSVCFIGASGRDHLESNSSKTGRPFRPSQMQYFDKRWRNSGKYELTSFSLYRPYVHGNPSGIINYSFDDRGELLALRFVKGSKRIALFTYSAIGTILYEKVLSSKISIDCQPLIVQASPAILQCTSGDLRVYSINSAGNLNWSAKLSGSASRNVASHTRANGVTQLIVYPYAAAISSTPIIVYEIDRSGDLQSKKFATVKTLTGLGGGLKISSDLGSGWVVASTTWAPTSRACARIDHYSARFALLWSALVSGSCSGYGLVGPVVSNSYTFIEMNGITSQKLLEIRPNGQFGWMSTIRMDGQYGLIVNPVIAVNNSQFIWLAGNSNGNFTEPGTGGLRGTNDYSYVAAFSKRNGTLQWKMRSTDGFRHGTDFINYRPEAIMIRNGVVTVVDSGYTGTPSRKMPIAIILKVRTRP